MPNQTAEHEKNRKNGGNDISIAPAGTLYIMYGQQKTETMNANSKHNTEETEESIYAKTLQAVNAVGYPAAVRQMHDGREEIYTRIVRKIHADSASARKNQIRFNRLYAVTAILIILSTAATAYWLGIRNGRCVLAQNPIEVTVPYGVIAGVTLPDGSQVTLNSGSRLTYPAQFEGDRAVSLSGEGFFDIVEGRTAFIVDAAHLSVRVLGTRFDFKAYGDDPYTVLTLEEGRIKAIPAGEKTGEGIALQPDQQLILNNETGEIRRQVVDAREYISWKDSILAFRDLTLAEIAVILKRRFNVDIRLAAGKIKNERYVAMFKHGENIEQILDKLSYRRSWKYEIRNSSVIEITEN
jgi:ferric-dicitrate binding protein FerR (iron transport regulator)